MPAIRVSVAMLQISINFDSFRGSSLRLNLLWQHCITRPKLSLVLIQIVCNVIGKVSQHIYLFIIFAKYLNRRVCMMFRGKWQKVRQFYRHKMGHIISWILLKWCFVKFAFCNLRSLILMLWSKAPHSILHILSGHAPSLTFGHFISYQVPQLRDGCQKTRFVQRGSKDSIKNEIHAKKIWFEHSQINVGYSEKSNFRT